MQVSIQVIKTYTFETDSVPAQWGPPLCSDDPQDHINFVQSMSVAKIELVGKMTESYPQNARVVDTNN